MTRLRVAIKRIGRREFVRHWFIAFASSVALFSGLFALLPKLDFTVARSMTLVVACVSIGLAYGITKTRPTHLIVSELTPRSLRPGPHMTLALHCTRSLLAQVHELASVIYGDEVPSIPFERYEQWLISNCNILACLLNENQRAVGYFDVLPLRDDFAQFFVDGIVGELDIRREHILPPSAAKQCKFLYLAGFAVADPATMEGGRHASCLFWGLIRYLEHFYQPFAGKRLFAAGATPEGERILQRYNFQLVQPGKLRRDGYPLYGTTLSSRLLRSASVVPDWSKVCRLAWESVPVPLTGTTQVP